MENSNCNSKNRNTNLSDMAMLVISGLWDLMHMNCQCWDNSLKNFGHIFTMLSCRFSHLATGTKRGVDFSEFCREDASPVDIQDGLCGSCTSPLG